MKKYDGNMKKYEEICGKYENKDPPYIWAVGLGKNSEYFCPRAHIKGDSSEFFYKVAICRYSTYE